MHTAIRYISNGFKHVVRIIIGLRIGNLMTMNINKRNRPSDLGDREFRKAIKMIKNDFTVGWLDDHNNFDHPLTVLFRRNDVFASDQLFQLGYSLGKIKSINRVWYDRAIEEIKKGERSRIRGEILEILIASQLHYPPDRVVELPDSINNPGYDLVMKINEGLNIYVQVKNNGETAKFAINEKTQNVEQIVKENLQSRDLKVLIFKNDNTYPDDISWHHLRENLPRLMQGELNENRTEIEGGWTIGISDLNRSMTNLHPLKPSYEMLLAMPLSQEEKNNLLTKITEACSVLGRKKEDDDERSIFIALVRVPFDAPFRICGDLAHQYFEDSPIDRASGVLFYKAGAVADPIRNENYLAHAYHLVLRNDRRDLITALNSSIFEKIDVGIGRGAFSIDGINESDIYNHLCIGDTEMRLNNVHLCQLGEINYLLNRYAFINHQGHRGVNAHFFFLDSDGGDNNSALDWPADDEPLLF